MTRMTNTLNETSDTTDETVGPWPACYVAGVAGLLLLTALLKATSPSSALSIAATYGLSYKAIVVVVLVELAVAARGDGSA